MTLSKKIEMYIDQFETKQRNEETIVVFKSGASAELRDSVMKAHGDRLPDDWIFNTYHSILCALSEYTIEKEDDLEENRGEIVDGLVDVYTSNLTTWLNSHNSNVYYLEEAQKEFGPIEDGFKLLSTAQYMAIDEIYSEVIELLTAE